MRTILYLSILLSLVGCTPPSRCDLSGRWEYTVSLPGETPVHTGIVMELRTDGRMIWGGLDAYDYAVEDDCGTFIYWARAEPSIKLRMQILHHDSDTLELELGILPTAILPGIGLSKLLFVRR
jgi:hypothetical protein